MRGITGLNNLQAFGALRPAYSFPLASLRLLPVRSAEFCTILLARLWIGRTSRLRRGFGGQVTDCIVQACLAHEFPPHPCRQAGPFRLALAWLRKFFGG